MNREVKLVLVFAAAIAASISTITFVRQYVALMQLERLDAPLTEVSEDARGHTDSETMAHRPRQQHNQVLQILEEDSHRQKQVAESRLVEAINEQLEPEETPLCPEDSDTQQCS